MKLVVYGKESGSPTCYGKVNISQTTLSSEGVVLISFKPGVPQLLQFALFDIRNGPAEKNDNLIGTGTIQLQQFLTSGDGLPEMALKLLDKKQQVLFFFFLHATTLNILLYVSRLVPGAGAGCW